MKAIVLKQFGGTENFQLDEVETPTVKYGMVKVEIKATAFNPIDYQMRRGSAESKLLTSMILGREMSGIIVGLHPSVTNFEVGDEVYGYVSNLGSNGSYAQFIVVPEVIIAKKPINLSFNQAAAVSLVGLTAIQAIEKCAVTNDHTVFISGGAGGVGSMLIRLLVQKGVTKIYTTAGNIESNNQIISYGLPKENIIDYKSGAVLNKLSGLTDNRKVDLCMDTVGNQMSDICAEAVKVHGTYVDITFSTTEKARELLFDKGVTIINVSNYAYGLEGDQEKMKYYNSRLTQLKEYFENYSMTQTPINIVGGFSVDTVMKAHSMLENNETRGCKLIMEIN